MTTATTDAPVRIGAKLYAENPEVIDLGAYISIFHRWIQGRALDGLPIDVADYAHVPEGPGVMLIGHEADRALDLGESRPGILYQRKRDLDGDLAERIAAVIGGADRAATELEGESDAAGVRFGRDEIWLRFNDRLRTPNDDASLERVTPAVMQALGETRPGRDAVLERVADDPKGPLRIRIRLT